MAVISSGLLWKDLSGNTGESPPTSLGPAVGRETKSSFDFYRKQARRIDNEGSRNPCPALCKKEARRSKRRIGRSYCKQARPRRMKLRGKHSPLLVKHTGHLFIHSFDVVERRASFLQSAG